MKLALRPYQAECLEYAKQRNTIVHLPTGLGKTLIAARLIDYYLEQRPNQKIAVLVPTRALVEQQATYFATYCSLHHTENSVKVQRLVGDEQAHWGVQDWKDSLNQCHVFCGTAALFQQAFVTDKSLDIGCFSLFVFDECHNATGNSPMAAVMRDAVAPHYLLAQQRGQDNISPRILGLTASFNNGKSHDLEKKRRKLEALLQSTIICPNVKERIQNDRFHFVQWERNPNIDAQKQAIESHVQVAVDQVADVRDMAKVLRNCSHVFEELGLTALFFYLDRVVVSQIVAKVNDLEARTHDPACVGYAARMKQGLPALRDQLAILRDQLGTDLVAKANAMTKKVEMLIDLIKEVFSEYGGDFRGIIFVEQVALVSTLAKLLNDAFQEIDLSFGAVAGSGYQSENDRQEQLSKFGTGHLHVLVSSAALEEGIDVSDCGFVIRFTSVKTVKAHIQGAGRARHENAIVYYFENDPVCERQKESTLTAIARDASLSCSLEELNIATSTIAQPVTHCHPFPFPASGDAPGSDLDGQVNVYNCKQIFNQYCSIMLGTTIQPKKDLFKYAHQPGEQKVISHVRFPTPTGWQSICSADYQSFWHGIDMEAEVFASAERSKRKSTSDKEEMCFVYMLVVHLRRLGHLDARNHPNKSMAFETRQSCPLGASWSDAIAIKNSIFQTS